MSYEREKEGRRELIGITDSFCCMELWGIDEDYHMFMELMGYWEIEDE